MNEPFLWGGADAKVNGALLPLGCVFTVCVNTRATSASSSPDSY
jgi:hypothetical protein